MSSYFQTRLSGYLEYKFDQGLSYNGLCKFASKNYCAHVEKLAFLLIETDQYVANVFNDEFQFNNAFLLMGYVIENNKKPSDYFDQHELNALEMLLDKLIED